MRPRSEAGMGREAYLQRFLYCLNRRHGCGVDLLDWRCKVKRVHGWWCVKGWSGRWIPVSLDLSVAIKFHDLLKEK